MSGPHPGGLPTGKEPLVCFE